VIEYHDRVDHRQFKVRGRVVDRNPDQNAAEQRRQIRNGPNLTTQLGTAQYGYNGGRPRRPATKAFDCQPEQQRYESESKEGRQDRSRHAYQSKTRPDQRHQQRYRDREDTRMRVVVLNHIEPYNDPIERAEARY
jgi:hypothetical protein